MSNFKCQRGVALVELALTIGILITIVFGITEFGRAIYQYDTLAKAARDAARYLSTKAPGDATAIGDAQCYAVHGNPSCTGSVLAPGLTTAMVSVCDAVSCPATHQAQGAAPVVNLVSVTIGGANNPYPFNSLVEFVVPSFNFGAISVTMRQVL
ncbi:MAG: TadE family protein [Burkholderiales bacterium]